MNSRTTIQTLALLFALLFTAHSASAQISHSVGLLKGEITTADGAPLANIPVVIFRGVDRVTSTKSNPSGEITTILQPNGVYRFAINERGYMYNEDTLRVPALSAYRVFPIHITLTPLHDGQLFDLPQPVFEPRSSEIAPGAPSELDEISFQLQHQPKLSISVVVYPDAPVKSKRDATQKGLAAARTAAIQSFFNSKGIASDRFTVESVTTTIPDGKFPMPANLISHTESSRRHSRKRRKENETATPLLFPQYVEIMAHLAP